MKCQILFSGKNKKNNIILSSAENAQRVVKVNAMMMIWCFTFLSTLFNPSLAEHDMPCLSKQCRSRSVGFF